jgi:hypothetical protein
MATELDYIWKLWKNYKKNTPTAAIIQELLQFKPDDYFNDHIAFRTVNIETIDKRAIASFFEQLGWKIKESYHFEKKKLKAIHLEHYINPMLPKIFISELILEKVSLNTRTSLIESFTRYMHTPIADLLLQGRKHNIYFKKYNELSKESEYASWLYIFGFLPNHFTVYLNNYPNLNIEDFTLQLAENKICINKSGSAIKGSKSVGLKQASTLADIQNIKFEDVEALLPIPSCYVEFAERFDVKGKIFNGFITNSADNIFDSTNNRNIKNSE